MNPWTIIFDLDGVLADIKTVHFETLNQALAEIYPPAIITWDEHLRDFDGLKSVDKLLILTQQKGLPVECHEQVWQRKQELTLTALRRLSTDSKLIRIMETLERDRHTLAVCSNSIRQTCYCVLHAVGVLPYLKLILSNEDVEQAKPHPEIYWKAMSILKANLHRTLIIEDSPKGLEAANLSGAKVLQIKNSQDLTLDKIQKAIVEPLKIAHRTKLRKSMNIVIPMGGFGRRFAEKGYTFPKPLIEVEGKPMIQRVIENITLDGRFIFIVDPPTLEKYRLDTVLNILAPGCVIIPEHGPRQGAAYATLLAREYIDNDSPLIIANSDQLVDWNPLQFYYKCQEMEADGSILTFESIHPKWSFARTDDKGIVQEVAEKNPISNQATVGIYLWSKGKDYIRSLEQMIAKDIKVNGEYYVCPVYNEGIELGMKFITHPVQKMYGLGTPEDLDAYLAREE